MKHAIAFAVYLASAMALTGATLSILPTTTTVVSGQTFTLDVAIADANDVYAYQFDIGFDPTLVQATGVMAGPWLSTGGATLFLPGVIDNAAGTVAATAESLQSMVPGVSGAGTLARVSFVSVGAGTATVSPFSVLVLDSTLFGITVDTATAEVMINPIPEPSTILPTACGMLVLALAVRRQSRRS
jgi:general secretion pathway protein D